MTVFHNPAPDQVVLAGAEGRAETRAERGAERSSERSSERILALIKENPIISAQQIAQALSFNARTVEKHLSSLKNKGILKRIGPDFGGRWEVLGEGQKG